MSKILAVFLALLAVVAVGCGRSSPTASASPTQFDPAAHLAQAEAEAQKALAQARAQVGQVSAAEVLAENGVLSGAQNSLKAIDPLLREADTGLNLDQNTEGDVVLASGAADPVLIAHDKPVCARAIDARVSLLTSLSTALPQARPLTPYDLSAFSASIQSALAGLATLKAALSAETTLPNVQADCSQIVTGFRVQTLIAPQYRLLLAAADAPVAAVALQHLAALIQPRVDSAAGLGKDVSAVQAILTDLKAKATAPQQQAPDLIAQLNGLKATGYPGNRPTLLSVRASLTDLQTALGAAVTDGQNAMAAMQAIK